MLKIYYNEHDPFAAAWLRNLIAAGLISPASAAGPTPSGLPGGRTTGRSGPAVVPVSRFRARESNKAMPTNDTCGPLFTASSPSAALQLSLESRLRARLAANGSPEYVLTWKTWDMPSGPPICALRASGRRTSGNGCFGWPSPKSSNTTEAGRRGDGGENLQTAAHRGTPDTLTSQARLTGWATPAARDFRHPNAKSYAERGGASSFWSSAEFIECADGKARRVEPTIFPLAHGIPNRVGVLRGSGNAIVPQIAAEFVKSFMQC